MRATSPQTYCHAPVHFVKETSITLSPSANLTRPWSIPGHLHKGKLLFTWPCSHWTTVQKLNKGQPNTKSPPHLGFKLQQLANFEHHSSDDSCLLNLSCHSKAFSWNISPQRVLTGADDHDHHQVALTVEASVKKGFSHHLDCCSGRENHWSILPHEVCAWREAILRTWKCGWAVTWVIQQNYLPTCAIARDPNSSTTMYCACGGGLNESGEWGTSVIFLPCCCGKSVTTQELSSIFQQSQEMFFISKMPSELQIVFMWYLTVKICCLESRGWRGGAFGQRNALWCEFLSTYFGRIVQGYFLYCKMNTCSKGSHAEERTVPLKFETSTLSACNNKKVTPSPGFVTAALSYVLTSAKRLGRNRTYLQTCCQSIANNS